MKIDGALIANRIKNDLAGKVNKLLIDNIHPHLGIIIVGSDPSSLVYIKRKKLFGEEIGIKVSVIHLPSGTKESKLVGYSHKMNTDDNIHGVIIQRPLAMNIDKNKLDRLISPSKDVDGFHPKSLFQPPIALAVDSILRYIYQDIFGENNRIGYYRWLKSKRILLIGRGETAGQPVANFLSKIRVDFSVAHSKTRNFPSMCQDADIILSCVGKSNIVRRGYLNKNSIVIGIGLHPENNRLATDYDQEEISSKALYFTPVPGGVGPVNVACLFKNLVSGII